MFEILDKSKTVSRRSLLTTIGKAGAGAVVLAGAGGLVSAPSVFAAKGGPALPWPYKKIDPEKAAERAYQSWYGNYCAMAVADGIIGTLQETVGGPYKNFPLEAIRFAHGGGVGWGTLCGTLAGAGVSSALVAGTTEGDHIINDIMQYYATEYLPTYKPVNAKFDEDPDRSRAGSPLCHVSVGKWMKKTGHEFFTKNRKDRCARLAANVTMKTVELLNLLAEDEYEPSHGSQMKTHNMTAQNNCLDCHGG